MKKWKYLIIIIVVCVCVFIGIEVFRKESNVSNNNEISTHEISENAQTNQDIEKDIIDNAHLTQNLWLQEKIRKQKMLKMKKKIQMQKH